MLKQIFFLGVTLFYFVSSERPGQCPKATGLGVCVIACKSDEDCQNEGDKCCGTSCGGQICKAPIVATIEPITERLTVPAVFASITKLPSKKPGLCPLGEPVLNPRPTLCTKPECYCDFECPGDLKCCSNFCGSGVCTDLRLD